MSCCGMTSTQRQKQVLLRLPLGLLVDMRNDSRTLPMLLTTRSPTWHTTSSRSFSSGRCCFGIACLTASLKNAPFPRLTQMLNVVLSKWPTVVGVVSFSTMYHLSKFLMGDSSTGAGGCEGIEAIERCRNAVK